MPAQRTLDQLLALFVDNNAGDISAGDGRDLIVTLFGWPAFGPPSADNDSVDSAGIGQFFSRGARWVDYDSQKVYFCMSGTPHMAIWVTWPDPTPAGVQQVHAGTGIAISGTLADPVVNVLPGYPASDLGGGTVPAGVSVPAANVGSGYAASDLGGGTVPAGVSVPAANVGSGYAASDLGGGTVPAGVAVPAANVGSGYPASDLGGGTVPAGVDVPWANVSGAPSPGVSMHVDHYAGTITGTSFTTLFDTTLAGGWIGDMMVFNNTNVQGLNVRCTFVDFRGTSYTNTILLGFFEQRSFNWLLSAAGVFGFVASYPPYNRIKIEIAGNGAGSNPYDIYNNYIGP